MRSNRPQRQRSAARTVHLIAAAMLGAFVYAPGEFIEPLRLMLQLVVIPAATITGVSIWKQAAIRRMLNRLDRGRSQQQR